MTPGLHGPHPPRLPGRSTWGAASALAAALVVFACETDPRPRAADADAAVDTSADARGGDVGACTPSDPGTRTTAELAVAADGSLRDALDRDVVLRGLNTGGRSKWAPYVPFEWSDEASDAPLSDLADAYFARMVGWGLDTARMPFSWEGLEPVRGEWDDDYLDRYEVLVDAAWRNGLGVIVDFHQDVFSAQFCGDGFPLWAAADIFDGPARRDCDDWFTGYLTNPDVAAAFDRLWDAEGQLRADFEAMWTRVATRFADHPGVVGFEIVNEPHWGTALADPWKRDVLRPFHTEMAALIHAIAPTKLVFYDSTGIDAVAPQQAHHRPEGEFLVYAPHFYDFGLLAGREPTSPAPMDLVARFATVRQDYSVPILIGEFGYAHGATGGDTWLAETMDAVDRFRLSATLWEYSVAPELWNGEDLSVVSADGTDRPILDTYVRPWIRALSGRDAALVWTPATSTGEATWESDGGVTEIRLPTRLFPSQATLLVQPEAACAIHDVASGRLLVQAPAGADVTVTFSR